MKIVYKFFLHKENNLMLPDFINVCINFSINVIN